MQQVNIILNQISILAIIAFLAYVGVKTGYVNGELKDHIGKLIVRVTMPLLVITTLTHSNVNGNSLINGLMLCGLAYLTVAIMFIVGYSSSKLFKLKGQQLVINTCASMFGNVIFLGYPIIEAIFGGEGLFYAVLFSICSDSLAFTLGIVKMSGKQGEASLKRLINPNTISFLIAIIMLLLGVKFPAPIDPAFKLIGSATTPLSMIFIGAVLASVDIKGIYKKLSLYGIVAVKLLINPLIIIAIMAFLPIDHVIKGVVVLQSAVPTQTMLSVLAKEYGSDYIYATEGIFATTIISIVTLPLVYYIFTII